MAYCVERDLYDFGLSRGSLPNPGRVLDSLESDTCALDVHGFVDDQEILFRSVGTGSALPPELAEGVTYYAAPVNESAFQVRTVPAGAALSITDATSDLLVFAPLPIASAIAWAERIIDDMLPAHAVPIEDGSVPEIIRMTCAELAAGKLATGTGSVSETLAKQVDGAQKRLERWAKGVPLRGANVPEHTNLAASATAPYQDLRGWAKYGGL